MSTKKSIIIGAGPAGLTAAYELSTRTEISVTVLERSEYMGGIARTINYKGNRIDIGGHRFFSKSDRVMNWWLNILPLQNTTGLKLRYQGQQKEFNATPGPDPEKTDSVMLVRSRKSRIYFLRQFFDYPISLNLDTILKLGLFRTFKIGLSYMKSLALPIKPEVNLEQFFINRFGKELYLTFFKSYTEKVWGVPCHEISAAWGAQRIKGLSILKTITHILKKIFGGISSDISQKKTETSLIEQFLYPKFGPGQMWEQVAKKVQDSGHKIITQNTVSKIIYSGNKISAVETTDHNNKTQTYQADIFFSTMAIKDLVNAMHPTPPAEILKLANGLQYRDFITVGLLVNKLKIENSHLKDNWIYIQEPDVLVGRLQIFNNWSPYMVSSKDKIWIGLEYFCYDNDPLWKKSDQDMIALAKNEMEKIGILDPSQVEDAVVIHMDKTYPAYFGPAYAKFEKLRKFLDSFENLYAIGRNGMHRYNNQDHSMLTAMVAVDNIIANNNDKSNLWAVNTEDDYHEES